MTILYKLIYWAGMVAQGIIRYPYQKTARAGLKTDRRVSRREDILLGLMTLVALVLPLVYSLTPGWILPTTTCRSGWGSAE